MIKINNISEFYEDTLPISVIVPLSLKRIDFFYNMVYPLLESNLPAEIIINDNIGTAPKKRNDGFNKSTQPFVFFCDDDILIPSNYLSNLFKTLKNNKNKGYAYTGYYGVVKDTLNHPIKNNFRIPTIPFNAEKLKQANYISTMSLIRREVFPLFDENLKRLQDWDVWLTMLKNNVEGIAVPNNEFMAFYLDDGITSNNNNEREGIMAILNKHQLI